MAEGLAGGFAEPVLEAQGAFRAIMTALANPGQPQALGPAISPPPGLAAALAIVALTLCDHDTPLWLADDLRIESITGWLRFHTGAPLADSPAAAQFALAADSTQLPRLADFALGTDEYPDRSTTVALVVPSLDGGRPLTLRGPGIRDAATIAPVGLPAGFIAQWTSMRELFPRGIDLLLVGGGKIVGLPRTTRIAES